jgi:glycosyltransferase involved in cell wall biosynthesis
LRVSLLSWSDVHGGAARAALRLHRALRAAGIESHMRVDARGGNDLGVVGPATWLQRLGPRLAARYDQLPVRGYRRRKPVLFSPAVTPRYTARPASGHAADITHLHWICNGFIPVEGLRRLPPPLVWTLHDQWAFTGGCHYSDGCTRYAASCGHCPILGSDVERDLSRDVWERKRDGWAGLDLTLIASSAWMARTASSSSLFRGIRVEVIPNCVDAEFFKPVDRAAVRSALNLPSGQRLILFAALSAHEQRRKGFHFLKPVLDNLAARIDPRSVCLAVLGMSQPSHDSGFSFGTHYLGVADEARLALVYAAADVFIALSTEDNLPYTVMEALSCGTPCIAFDVGGMRDMIEHQSNGALVQPFDPAAFADAINWVLADQRRHEALSHRARQSAVERFSPGKIARRHVALYEELHRSRRSS